MELFSTAVMSDVQSNTIHQFPQLSPSHWWCKCLVHCASSFSSPLLLIHSLITTLGNVEEPTTANRTQSCKRAAALSVSSCSSPWSSWIFAVCSPPPPQIYCQLYIQPITRSKLQLQEGFICRWWLASVPFGVDSALPNNSFTAQRPLYWWQQLSPRYRNTEESKNTLQTRAGWAWSIYQKVRNYNLCLFYCLIFFNSMCTFKTVHNGPGLAPWAMLCNLRSAELYSSSPHVACEIGPRRTGAYFQPRRGHCMLPLGLTPAPAIKNVFFIPANSFWSMGLVLCHSEESFLGGYMGWAPGPHADWRGATCL